MAQFKKIYIDLYKRNILVFIGSHQEFQLWCQEYYQNLVVYDELVELVLHSDDNAQASFWYNPITCDNIIELEEYPKTPEQIACMVHEALHATMKILSFVDVEYKKGGANEAYTYLLEFLVKNILVKDDYKYIRYDVDL